MRRMCVVGAVVGCVVTLLVWAPGCFDYAADCRNIATCPPSTGDGGPSPACVPSLNSGSVADMCGVFVSSEHGDDTNGKGTQAAPYKSITKALTKGSTIYACAGTTPYSEALSLDTEVTLFGALDCGTWGYDAANKTQLTALSDMVPLTLASTAGGSAVEDFSIMAADATAVAGSSIAVLDDGATASFTRTDITAGKGADGAAGMTPVGLRAAGGRRAHAEPGDGARRVRHADRRPGWSARPVDVRHHRHERRRRGTRHESG